MVSHNYHNPYPNEELLPEWTKFTAEVERFLLRHEMRATTFGRLASNSTALVHDIRRGKIFGLKRMARIRAFMRNYNQEKTK